MIKVFFTEFFLYSLREQVNYISKDKPIATKKFRSDLITNLKKDLQNPFNYKKSMHFNDENKRDYVFKGYTSVFEYESTKDLVTVFAFTKYKQKL